VTNVLALPLAHLVIETSNNEDWIDTLVVMVSDSGPPLEQMDLHGISFTMHLRRRPEIHEIVLDASTKTWRIYIGSPPDIGYLIFYVRREVMQTLWAGKYVGDIVANDKDYERVCMTVDFTVIEGPTKQ
jgi:hypothetical protein